VHEIVAFHYPKCINKEDGGYLYLYFFFNDGLVTVHSTRHIVSTTRFIFILSLAAALSLRWKMTRPRDSSSEAVPGPGVPHGAVCGAKATRDYLNE
jgi:hypothetical protein